MTKDELILEQLPFVRRMANNYSKSDRTLADDLISVGTIALYTAYDKFDFTKEYKFWTYAKYWVKHDMQRFLYNHPLRFYEPVVSRDLQLDKWQQVVEQLNKLEPVDYKLIEGIYFNEKSMVDISEELGVSKQRIHQKKKKIITNIRNEILNG